jgi:hypothetical protein
VPLLLFFVKQWHISQQSSREEAMSSSNKSTFQQRTQNISIDDLLHVIQNQRIRVVFVDTPNECGRIRVARNHDETVLRTDFRIDKSLSAAEQELLVLEFLVFLAAVNVRQQTYSHNEAVRKRMQDIVQEYAQQAAARLYTSCHEATQELLDKLSPGRRAPSRLA